MKTLTAQQSALFKLQLWHVRQQKSFERDIREFERRLSQPAPADWLSAGAGYYESLNLDLRLSKLHATKHRKFVDAITPFLLP